MAEPPIIRSAFGIKARLLTGLANAYSQHRTPAVGNPSVQENVMPRQGTRMEAEIGRQWDALAHASFAAAQRAGDGTKVSGLRSPDPCTMGSARIHQSTDPPTFPLSLN
ncbi:MAG: hypothetical protein IPM12_07485 [Flavobacteriales bacterium]|nr:hypothetical protein [Flavobacteriales bacterium]